MNNKVDLGQHENEASFSELLEEAVRFLLNGRWWILMSAFVIALAGTAIIAKLPAEYTSEAVLVIVQQQIPQQYVDPAISISTSDRIRAISREVLSRSRLMGIIDAFGLYPAERTRLTPDLLVERMRKDVDIEFLDPTSSRVDFGAFKVSFSARTPQLAQQVASRLTALFVEENLRSRGDQAAGTTKFLTEQLNAAKSRLDQQEQRLSAFKQSNTGELPEQQQLNLTALTDARMQLQSVSLSLTRARQQQGTLETLIASQLSRLQSEKTGLMAKFTAKHPEVVKKEQEIDRVAALAARLKNGEAGDKGQSFSAPEDVAYTQLKIQVDANFNDIDNLTKEEARLRADVGKYQARLQLTPVREQQLTGILRDYETYKQEYTDLLGKQLKSQLTTNLEERQEGQHFRLVDPPSLPAEPSKPKRLKLSLGAAGAGIAVGILLGFLTHMRDSSIHSEKVLKRRFVAPVLLALPEFLTPAEERNRFWKRTAEWAVGVVMVATIVLVELYVYRRGVN